jgi:hypothetical protein
LTEDIPRTVKVNFCKKTLFFRAPRVLLRGKQWKNQNFGRKEKIKTFGIGRSGRSEGFVSQKKKELLTRARHTSGNVSHLSKQSDFSATFDLRRTTKTGSKFSVRKARVVRERRKRAFARGSAKTTSTVKRGAKIPSDYLPKKEEKM